MLKKKIFFSEWLFIICTGNFKPKRVEWLEFPVSQVKFSVVSPATFPRLKQGTNEKGKDSYQVAGENCSWPVNSAIVCDRTVHHSQWDDNGDYQTWRTLICSFYCSFRDKEHYETFGCGQPWITFMETLKFLIEGLCNYFLIQKSSYRQCLHWWKSVTNNIDYLPGY